MKRCYPLAKKKKKYIAVYIFARIEVGKIIYNIKKRKLTNQ